jgi:hypothetical protein
MANVWRGKVYSVWTMEKPGQTGAVILGGKRFPPKCHGVSMLPTFAQSGVGVQSFTCSVCKQPAAVNWPEAEKQKEKKKK